MSKNDAYMERLKVRDPAIPTVYGLIEENQFVFSCPFCGVDHRHGYLSPDDLSHRDAHCKNSDSPFKKTGYYLELKRNREFI